jgi:hypothetical protein
MSQPWAGNPPESRVFRDFDAHVSAHRRFVALAAQAEEKRYPKPSSRWHPAFASYYEGRQEEDLDPKA